MKYKKHFFLLFSVIYFIVVLILLFSVRSLSYNHYERINFESSGASIYANLFYPEGKLTFQEKHPFIIFAHGLGSQKDLDPRIPIEFTKRGFVVASIDYRGDGESTGHLLDINRDSYRNRTDVPAVAQDCSKLLDVIERHPVYDMINSSQIGLVGHSLGGMVALMTGALDERFKATVTWAGLVNASANFFGIGESNPFMNYIPARIINESNPQNLLVIHSIYDTTVPYETNALVAQNLTNCQLISITNHILGGQHYLFSDEVLTGTINWFEAQFFNSTTLNGPISLTYFQTYILLFLAILGTFLTTIAIIIWITDFFIIVKDKSCTLSDQREKIGKKINKRHVLKQSIKISLYFSGFLLIWITYFTLMGILGLIFAPIFIILIFFVWIVLKYIGTTEDKKQNIKLYIVSKLKEEIKSQCRKHVLLYSLVSTAIFLGLYFSLSISYPFAFFSPLNVLSFILTYTIYPFYLAIELFYRKVVYEDLNFISSPTIKTIITALMGIINIGILMVLSYNLFLISAFYMTFLIFLAVMILNSVIYEKTNKFSSVLISSFIIIQIFFGSAVSVVFGFGPLARLLS